MSVNEKMTAIADAIRDKTDGTEALTLENMASGVNEVFDAGKKSEYDSFWDSANLDNVSPTSFSGNLWNDETFKPSRDIIWGDNSAQWSFANNRITNLKACLERLGVKLDMSRATAFGYAFATAITEELPEINMSGAKHTGLTSIGGNMPNLIRAEIVLPSAYPDNPTESNSIFANCSKLQHLTVKGLVDFSWNLSKSPLSVESMKSVISCLKDYAGDTANEHKYTITFKASAFKALEAEGATSPKGNTWTEYIDDLKWNLVKA